MPSVLSRNTAIYVITIIVYTAPALRAELGGTHHSVPVFICKGLSVSEHAASSRGVVILHVSIGLP